LVVETLIGYAWLPVFKSGRLLCGERALPVAQSLSTGYLTIEQIGMGQMIGPSDVKWVEYMKPLFKVSTVAASTVHTTDAHVANFYTQYEKLLAATNTSTPANNSRLNSVSSNLSGGENKENVSCSSSAKRRAPVLSPNLIETAAVQIDRKIEESVEPVVTNGKEVIRSSNKVTN
jgi:hypothetical protein